MKENYELIINNDNSGKRLDISISNLIPNLTRSSLKKYSKNILVNNKKEKFSYKCKTGDLIKLEFEYTEIEDIIPENIPIDIVYEDINYIIINKKSMMVVHPAKGNYKGTLLNALLGLNKKLSNINDKFRPGIVHRLDKETSGLIIIAKNNQSHNYLNELFKNRNILKKYHAIVKGVFLPLKIKIINNIGRNPKNRKKMAVLKEGGKKSITSIEKVKHINGYSYLDIRLLTGRTHQIRVQLSNYGFPILGDMIYSKKDKIFTDIGLCLVAYRLSFYDKFSDKNIDIKIKDPVFIKEAILKIKKSI